MEAIIILIIVLIVLAVAAIRLAPRTYVKIPQGYVGIKKRLGQREWDAKVLEPGPHLVTPWLFRVEKVEALQVPPDKVGVVTAREGARKPSGQVVGRRVACDYFQDSADFLANGGQQGPQVTLLPGGNIYYLNPHLFTVRLEPRTRVPSGTIGLVVARAGEPLAPGQFLGRHVECGNFQDGAAFLDGGGQQGRQLAVLPSGEYDIHPELFQVITQANAGPAVRVTPEQLLLVTLDTGSVGVVITAAGRPPERGGNGELAIGRRVDGHECFQRPWTFLDNGGHKGIQQEILPGGGTYALNPWFVSVVPVPTRNVAITWLKGRTGPGLYDADLEPIETYISGHKVRFELTQEIKIRESAAPKLLCEFGVVSTLEVGGLIRDTMPVRKFVSKILGSTVESYFTRATTKMNGRFFNQDFTAIQDELGDNIRNALEDWGVDALRTTLGTWESDDPDFLAPAKAKFKAERDQDVLKEEIKSAELHNKLHQIKSEEKKREAITELLGLADLFGRENALMIKTIQEYSNLKVPNYIGGAALAEIASAMPVPALNALLERLRTEGPRHGVAAGEVITGAEPLDAIEGSDLE
jgi:hypothetical protein